MINLHLYQGKGEAIETRGLKLPKYSPLFDTEKPENYIAPPGLRDAVNVALALGQPLLLTGEPGTGKTRVADSIAYELGIYPPLVFYTKTTSAATDLFYEYDALRRFQDSHLPEKRQTGMEEYITYRALGLAILLTKPAKEGDLFLPPELRGKGPMRSVILIDEIDKAPRDLPNDVLNEMEQMEFTVKETGRTFRADREYRPIAVLTSNSEKNLPDAFLRRCVFYHIPFPEKKQLAEILCKRFSRTEFRPEFTDALVEHFDEIRKLDLKKKPATAEFLAWVSVLESLGVDNLRNLSQEKAEMLALSYSVLAKTHEDLARVKKELEKKIKM